MVSKYRYILDIEGVTHAVTPLNIDGIEISYDAPADYRFSYIPKLTKKMAFVGADFWMLYAHEKSNVRCRFVNLEIEKNCGGGWGAFQSGKIRMVSGDWDLDKCSVVFDVELITNYDCFDENDDVEVNLFDKVIDVIETKIYRGDLEYVEYTTSIVRDFFKASEFPEADPETKGWILWKYVPNVPNNPTSWTYFYVREVITVDCDADYPVSMWVEIEACSGGTKKLARPGAFYQKKITGYDMGGRPPRRGYNLGPDAIEWAFTSQIFAFNTIDNGMLLEDVLNSFSQGFCSKPVKSVFFQIDPDASFESVYPTLPPLTSINNVVYQKSDVKRPNDYSNATKATTTFKKFMNALCRTYNLQFIITDTEFRIEHVSYFPRILGIDTTLPKYASAGRQARSYTYLSDKLPIREKFEMMEQGNTDFIGLPIEYKGACVNVEKEDKIQTEIFTTDMIYTMDGGIKDEDGQDNGKVVDAGFVLVATEKVGDDYFILRESGLLDPNSKLNNVLAWAQLHRDYWKWERPLINGFMNGQYTIFNTARPVKKGEKITIPFCCGDTYKLTDLARSILGDGIVDRAVFNLYNETLELDLLFREDTPTFICFPPTFFAFDHRDGNDFYFNTQFVDDGTYTTEIVVTDPNGDKITIGPITESNGIGFITLPDDLINGKYYFAKRVICGTEYSEYTGAVEVAYESPDCDKVIAASALEYVNYSITGGGPTFKFKTLSPGAVLEVEITRPDSVVYMADLGPTTSIGGVNTYSVLANKTGYTTAPTSGLFKFRFRLRCNSIAVGAWSDFKNVTI